MWNTNKKFAFTYAPILKPGIVKKLSVPKYDYMKHIFVTMKNNTIEKLQNCSQRPLFYIVEGNSELDAIKKAKTIEREIEIEYE